MLATIQRHSEAPVRSYSDTNSITFKSAPACRAFGNPRAVSGVVDPRESRRITYFLYWVLMPFVFGIGDMGRANAFRYNVFLTEDWKADLKRLFSTVRYAIFDCQAITPNVAWEMRLAREMLPPERVFFIATSDAAALRKQVAALPRGNEVEIAQCFTVANWRNLSKTLLSQFGHC